MNKVHCENCKWFKINQFGMEFCSSPNNCKETYKTSCEKMKPYELNKNNDCKYFDRK